MSLGVRLGGLPDGLCSECTVSHSELTKSSVEVLCFALAHKINQPGAQDASSNMWKGQSRGPRNKAGGEPKLDELSCKLDHQDSHSEVLITVKAVVRSADCSNDACNMAMMQVT